MSIATDLLEQAYHLAAREPRRPRQASLRRAVSACYYALFHLLVHEASRMLVTGTPLRQLVSRTFVHSEMKRASESFARRRLSAAIFAMLGSASVSAPLVRVAQAFVDLQQARHEADYNLARTFGRSEVQTLVNQAEQAFADWGTIRGQPDARLYLVCLLLWQRLGKIP